LQVEGARLVAQHDEGRRVNRLPGARRQWRPIRARMAIPLGEPGRDHLRGVRSRRPPGADRQPA
jgi:hypothetical protein